MLRKRVIPCVEIRDGRVAESVRIDGLREGVDPIEAARRFANEGADEIAIVDTGRGQGGRGALAEAVRRIAGAIATPLLVVCDLRDEHDVELLIAAGASKVTLNTAATTEPELVERCSDRWGERAIVVAIEAKRQGTGYTVTTHGGRRARGLDAVAWAVEAVARGAGELLVTSVDREGTREGYDLSLTQAVSLAVPVPVVAWGGAGSLEHLYDALARGTADAVLAGSIFRFGERSVAEARTYLARRGVPVGELRGAA